MIASGYEKIPLSLLQAKVQGQKQALPSLYGAIDFSKTPERFAGSISDVSMLKNGFGKTSRSEILANQDGVDRMLAYTMLGDEVADAYAALIPQYGFRRLVDMLVQACKEGADAVDSAPEELRVFIRSMEELPDWIDPDLSAEGARYSRVSMAMIVPFTIRGAFVATFMNKYSGLPMALTGMLSQNNSAQRVKETASFFTTATLPGALQRHGVGFHAAAMVRLMHSMVRVNLLSREGLWDSSVYGVPIPQIDQMPAGTMPGLIASLDAIRRGREFTRRERAIVEFCRHQCFLLGLPPELLRTTPQGIYELFALYAATLRDGYDDETNGELVRSTMAAYLPPDKSLLSRIENRLERSISKVFFKLAFQVSGEKAEQMGVVPNPLEYLCFAGFHAYALSVTRMNDALAGMPKVYDGLDKLFIGEINKRLVNYGHPEFTTDASQYAV